MQTADRRRMRAAIAVSLIAHVLVLGVAAVQSPTLFVPREDAGPPEPVIPILLMPRMPPPADGTPAPAPIRLHQRALRPLADEPDRPPPVTIPSQPPASPAPLPGPVAIEAAPAEVQQKADVRAALQGLTGCRDPDAPGLTAEQRDRCRQRLAAGAKDAPYLGSGISAEKQRALAAAGARKDAAMRQREAPLASGLSRPFVEPSDYDGEPYLGGAGVSALGQVSYPPSKNAAKKLEPLRP
jgi:hypothetical protein